MTRIEQITSILSHYIEVSWNQSGAQWEPVNRVEIEELARLIVEDPRIGSTGDGCCICAASPDWQEQSAKRMGFDSWLDESKKGRAGEAQLDHRCPWHGEQAQPRLWGRNRTLVLSVSAKQWASLGVVYAVEENGNAQG